MDNMDYKKIAECVRLCGSTPKIHECQEKCSYYCGRDMSKCIPILTKDAADAIIELKSNMDFSIKYMREMCWCAGCAHFGGVIRGCELGDMNKCTEENDLYEWIGVNEDEKSN